MPEEQLDCSSRLVGLGFRCWSAGYDTGSIECWENGWGLYRDALGYDSAKPVVCSLAAWMREVHQDGNRRLNYYPFLYDTETLRFSEDELLGIRLICACQMEALQDQTELAAALTGHSDNERMTGCAMEFARSLSDAGRVISGADIYSLDLPQNAELGSFH